MREIPECLGKGAKIVDGRFVIEIPADAEKKAKDTVEHRQPYNEMVPEGLRRIPHLTPKHIACFAAAAATVTAIPARGNVAFVVIVRVIGATVGVAVPVMFSRTGITAVLAALGQ